MKAIEYTAKLIPLTCKLLTFLTLLTFIFPLSALRAQPPEKMSYQTVLRDAGNNLVTNSTVGMKVSILQGGESGTAVYVETQTPAVNANGLLSVGIGTGSVVTGDFTAIDWTNGPYYLKTETDPEGGTNYTITEINQFLSVPYALHAKTADSITGTYNETDPVYAGSDAASITAGDITNLGNLSGTNTGDQDLSALALKSDVLELDNTVEFTPDADYKPATKKYVDDSIAQVRSDIPDVSGFITSETDPVYAASQAANISAGDITKLGNLSGTNTGDQDLSALALKTNVLELDNTTAFTPDGDYEPATKKYVDDNPPTYSVGDFAQGGIVFWIDETGQHGLVCAKADQDGGSGIRWYAGTPGDTRAYGDGPLAGEANTSKIIAAQVAIGDDGSTYAARICNELQITEAGKTYGDWYLPSKGELDLMYQNKATIDATGTANGGSAFASDYYWSSTECSNGSAWRQDFPSGNQSYYLKFTTSRVRAVRAF